MRPIRIQIRRNLIYGFSGRLRNTALTIKSEFFSQKDAGSKANHPLVRHRMLLAVEIASASKLSGSNRECNAFCRSGNLRKGRWFKKKCMHFILRNTYVLCCAYDNGGERGGDTEWRLSVWPCQRRRRFRRGHP